MKKAVLSVFFSNLTGAGLGFLVNVALARLLDVASFGRINLIFSLIMILYTVADFGFSNCLVIYYNRHRDRDGEEAIRQVNHLYLRFVGIICVIGGVAVLLLTRLYTLSTQETVITYCSFLLFALYRYMTSLHQAIGNWSRFNLLTVLNNILKFVCVISATLLLPLLATGMIPGQAALWGYLVYSIALAGGCYLASRYLMLSAVSVPAASRGEFLQLLYPIGIAGIFIIITMRFDSLIIEKVLGSQQLGIYSAANSLALVFPLLTGSLMNVLLRESAGSKESYLVKVMVNQRKYFAVLTLLLVVAWLLSGVAISVLFGVKYSQAIPVFKTLLIPYIGGIFFTPLESYYYANLPRLIMVFKFAQMLMVVAMSLLLIAPLGVVGVALSVLLSRVLGWGYLYVKSRKVLNGYYNTRPGWDV